MPGGSESWRDSATSRAPSATSSVLALDCLVTPMPIDSLPSARNSLRLFSVATSTSATSRRRMR